MKAEDLQRIDDVARLDLDGLDRSRREHGRLVLELLRESMREHNELVLLRAEAAAARHSLGEGWFAGGADLATATTRKLAALGALDAPKRSVLGTISRLKADLDRATNALEQIARWGGDSYIDRGNVAAFARDAATTARAGRDAEVRP